MSQFEPNWTPLEKLAEAAARSRLNLDPDEFMWMGDATSPAGERLELYKHRDTRQYLNVDAAGHTYRYTGNGYQPWRSPAPAIAVAYGRGLTYQCWTNLDAGFMRPYQPGDRLVRGWSDVIEVDRPATEVRFEALAEQVWMCHNRDERPDGQLCPSMSVGDVVVFGEAALSVDVCGFVRVNVDVDDLITDRTWRQVRDEPRRSAPATVSATTAKAIIADWGTAPARTAVDPPTPPDIGLGS